MSEQSVMADAIHRRLDQEPLTIASLVHEVRARWGPEHGVGSVHLFVEEVLSCLLREGDVDVADATPAGLVSWRLPPDEAWEKISRRLSGMQSFLEDDSWGHLRRKSDENRLSRTCLPA